VRPIVLALLGAVFLFNAVPSFAWWNADWTNRTKVTINGGAAGIAGAVAQAPVLVRLHTGNFSFLDAKQDGSDLRFVASDDKTPLKYHIEKWDALNELGLVWVQVPSVAAGTTPTEIWLYSGNEKAAPADDSKGIWDPAQVAVLQFREGEQPPKDGTGYANNASSFTGIIINQSLIGAGAAFNGSGRLSIPASSSLVFNGASGLAFSAWIKFAGPQQAVLFSQREGAAPLVVGISGQRPFALLGKVNAASTNELSLQGWHHIAVTAKDRLVLYVDGQQAATADVAPSEIKGAIEIGANFTGEMDELEIGDGARSADWFKLAAKTQGGEGNIVGIGQAESSKSSGGSSYLAILLGAVTLDGWVVIGILMVMMIVSFAVMIGKSIFVVRTDNANQAFIAQFRKLADLTQLYQTPRSSVDKTGRVRRQVAGGQFAGSSIYRIYHVGVDELQQRFQTYKERGQPLTLTSQSIGAIKATIDAGLIKETHRLNKQMVLLTIAISGGPFLGLLGTVVGVMITFAAIAAAGDVNVNSIAPGIAAALVATVAGLAVAIPALFGYNYLASRIKNITTDMQVFADELITKFAENYSN
jgi:biopolymer transport protein ExbB